MYNEKIFLLRKWLVVLPAPLPRQWAYQRGGGDIFWLRSPWRDFKLQENRESSSAPNKTSSTSNLKFLVLFFFYCGSFLPSWIRIHRLMWIRIQFGSWSEILEVPMRRFIRPKFKKCAKKFKNPIEKNLSWYLRSSPNRINLNRDPLTVKIGMRL